MRGWWDGLSFITRCLWVACFALAVSYILDYLGFPVWQQAVIGILLGITIAVWEARRIK